MSNDMNEKQLLAEVEELIRTCPPQSAFTEQANDEALIWLGRTAAVLREWDKVQSVQVALHISALQAGQKIDSINLSPQVLSQMSEVDQLVYHSDLAHHRRLMLELDRYGPAYRGLRTLFFQAQHDLRMKTIGPLSLAVPDGKPFDYFDEIRKITAMAREDLLFVDPYLDSEFVSRYLSQITSGVTVRLLTSKKLLSLLPAVKSLVEQSGLPVQVRSVTSGLHDRYVFVDKRRCYQSGASFKDGAKKSLTTLTQITDAFEAVFQTYGHMWDDAKVEYS